MRLNCFLISLLLIAPALAVSGSGGDYDLKAAQATFNSRGSADGFESRNIGGNAAGSYQGDQYSGFFGFLGLFGTNPDTDGSVCRSLGYTYFEGVVEGLNYRCCGDDGLSDDFYNGSISSTFSFCQDGIVTEQEIDVNDTICVTHNNEWFTGLVQGSNGACCGDDAEFDDFFNQSHYCYQGASTTDADLLQAYCEGLTHQWLTGTVTGSNAHCCGDDLIDDDFYNGSLSSTSHFCLDGLFIDQSIDESQDACVFYAYDWLPSATDLNSKCCGDDAGGDDFGSNVDVCCCNGELIASGLDCDFNEDGFNDTLCVNGEFDLDIFISESTTGDAYIESGYTPVFVVVNTGNETVCFTSVEILNTTLDYVADPANPDCIEPGGVGIFKFNFGGFDCDDLDQEYNPYVKFEYEKAGGETGVLVNYINFRILSPLDIVSVSPPITDSLAVPVNEFKTFLLTLQNKGTDVIDYQVDVTVSADVLLLFKTPERQYSMYEIETDTYRLLPGQSIVYQVKSVVQSEGEKSASINFINDGPCGNVSDAFVFQLTGFEEQEAFALYNVDALDHVSIMVLLSLLSFFFYSKVLKGK